MAKGSSVVGVVVGLALVAGVAGCGRAAPDAGASPGPTPSRSASSPSSSAPTTSPSATADDATADGDFSPAATVATAEPSGERVTVVDVRVGSHDGYDRVVYELGGGGVPGWRVQYVEQAFQDGSGAPVDVAGEAVLEVWLTGTGYPTDTGQTEFGEDVGPREGTVVEVTRPLTFEGMTQSVVGLDGMPRPFRVFALQDPVRVVVDVQTS
ncbi:AMIN-like domain-containing (lipo)protein [Cellulomonas fimi]|uniref:AMIN-like domain-containing protein n=1 Tax=Cellulomonas fimi (strain ATCC 484 / DSM 20113 / JCM 1341 / CCUG 24087 / LMG 16345 / NBRC 15513 / NCIMB 8980 / NCTC 7547 / NRS-133) TaxID=590998 RepID=F4H6S6_CELFA|nr:hypothetical protein [Cellulomonas fimi]AEE46837.1 hypothetical protein Celf_2713 [Cellulomonas fimi ATCC 484]NNH06380.1 hypothetical protein [Cellulomonas fimi]VEH34323.1 Uncharacterised protein [Cellulomonas fimi]